MPRPVSTTLRLRFHVQARGPAGPSRSQSTSAVPLIDAPSRTVRPPFRLFDSFSARLPRFQPADYLRLSFLPSLPRSSIPESASQCITFTPDLSKVTRDSAPRRVSVPSVSQNNKRHVLHCSTSHLQPSTSRNPSPHADGSALHLLNRLHQSPDIRCPVEIRADPLRRFDAHLGER